MTELVSQTVYFAQPGTTATERTLDLARARAEALGIRTVIVATTSGATAVRVAEAFSGLDVVAVTHSAGFRGPDMQDLDPANAMRLAELGVKVLTCQHALGGVGRAVRKLWGTYQLDEIIAQTLRLFGQGMKVAFEISLMAADAGLVSTRTPALVIAGSSRGADTAIILIPTNAQTFFDLKPLEIICMPSPQHPVFQ
ncbi:MAG: pyruvate kinase alpha/beta domain-containing protein [Anaerolineae bacterium]|jgi:hypothetical protein|nr:pyruvate kinase alpha/beta domain-containing protein [Anaerolineae bacterium]